MTHFSRQEYPYHFISPLVSLIYLPYQCCPYLNLEESKTEIFDDLPLFRPFIDTFKFHQMVVTFHFHKLSQIIEDEKNFRGNRISFNYWKITYPFFVFPLCIILLFLPSVLFSMFLVFPVTFSYLTNIYSNSARSSHDNFDVVFNVLSFPVYLPSLLAFSFARSLLILFYFLGVILVCSALIVIIAIRRSLNDAYQAGLKILMLIPEDVYENAGDLYGFFGWCRELCGELRTNKDV
ncbi:15090_t:CDS:1 [Acaulospora morrowiae]|uniref:15090_t:CDS:1 n=1 Tax=Acaulospora morrowiae TaxID=94023 RepID=A0A9N9F725_9GLOM|nr:15090_t:CDS:1 [Acaulospora morrowiae]